MTMNTKRKQSGITLMEMTVVVAAVALLGVLGLPAISAFINSLASSSGTKAMISAALSSARAIAVKEQHYAGVRFQKAYDPKGPLEAVQYMIFIVHDFDKTGLENGFRAVEGLEPIRLPEAVGVMDLTIVTNRDPDSYNEIRLDDPSLNPNQDDWINDNLELADTTTFSIIFSPSGKLVTHRVRTRNRDGIPDSPGELGNPSADDVFNKKDEVDNGIGMFYQDDYAAQDWRLRYYPQNFGFGEESSRTSFVIYERDKFKAAFENGRAWTDYLKNLDAIYINPYVGTIIEK